MGQKNRDPRLANLIVLVIVSILLSLFFLGHIISGIGDSEVAKELVICFKVVMLALIALLHGWLKRT